LGMQYPSVAPDMKPLPPKRTEASLSLSAAFPLSSTAAARLPPASLCSASSSEPLRAAVASLAACHHASHRASLARSRALSVLRDFVNHLLPWHMSVTLYRPAQVFINNRDGALSSDATTFACSEFLRAVTIGNALRPGHVRGVVEAGKGQPSTGARADWPLPVKS